VKNSILYSITLLLLSSASITITSECPDLGYLRVVDTISVNKERKTIALRLNDPDRSFQLTQSSAEALKKISNSNNLATCIYTPDGNSYVLGLIIPPKEMQKLNNLNTSDFSEGKVDLGYIGTFSSDTLVDKTDSQKLSPDLLKRIEKLKTQQTLSLLATNNNLNDQNTSSLFKQKLAFFASGICVGGICGFLLAYIFFKNYATA
jgi:hypothetical protein